MAITAASLTFYDGSDTELFTLNLSGIGGALGRVQFNGANDQDNSAIVANVKADGQLSANLSRDAEPTETVFKSPLP